MTADTNPASAPAKTDIVDRLNRMVAMPHVSFHYKDDCQAVAEAATEITNIRRELEKLRELHLLAAYRADNLKADVDKARALALEEAAQWHDAKAAHYGRQTHDTYGREEFHRESAAAIRSLAEGKEG